MMELPAYKTPDVRSVLFNLWLRAKIFINRAGRIILPLVIILWVLATFPYPPEDATLPAIDCSLTGVPRQPSRSSQPQQPILWG